MLEVNGYDLEGANFQVSLGVLKNASRPMTLGFWRPAGAFPALLSAPKDLVAKVNVHAVQLLKPERNVSLAARLMSMDDQSPECLQSFSGMEGTMV